MGRKRMLRLLTRGQSPRSYPLSSAPRFLSLTPQSAATLRSRPCNCSHGTASYLCSKYVFRVCSCKCRHDVRHRQSHTLRCSNVCVLPILHYCLLISSVYSLTDNEKLLTAKK